MKCPACGNELDPDAKFCGACGRKVESQDQQACPHCGNPVRPGAKFCGSCGKPVQASSPRQDTDPGAAKREDLREAGGFIYWNVLPGQVALKLDETDLVEYEGAKGIVVQDGTQALIFMEGALAAQLSSGRYDFKGLVSGGGAKPAGGKRDKPGIVKRVFGAIAGFIKGERGERLRNRLAGTSPKSLGIVLVREADFPLVFDLENVGTAGIRSELGIQLLCRISDANAFYRGELLDRKFSSLERIADALAVPVRNAVDRRLVGVAPDGITGDEALLAELQAGIGEEIRKVFPYLELVRLVRIEASREELEAIRRLREELYVSELELAELTKRNAFLNSLATEQNQQLLRQARSEQDFGRAMLEIDKDGLLTEDERARFAMVLSSQRLLREAGNQDQVDTAMAGFRKSDLLRKEELKALERDIASRADLKELADGQAVSLATFENQFELDRQRILWETEIGDRRHDIELERRRKQDSYTDERRRSEVDLDRAEQLSQLDILKQAQAIRLEREAHEHGLEMEKQRLDAETELEKKRIFAAMSFEQIMALNPDITPQAAQALAEKFKAEGTRAASDDKVAMAMAQKDEMRSFMEQQMSLMRDVVQSTAGIRNAIMDEKDRELARTREDAERHNDRYSEAMQTTVRAVAGARDGTRKKCPKCGHENEPDGKFCLECGTSL